jgi:hypothetical protein
MTPIATLIVPVMAALLVAVDVAPSQNDPVISGPVTVPEGNGAPVITDGLFSPGEWEDALRIALNEAVTLHFKEYRGVVFIGVRGQGAAGIGPSELSLAVPGGPIQKLHVSAQLFEVTLPPTGAEPPPRFGLTTGWYANELRRDMEESARLEKAGKSPIDIMRATSYPSDGIEFAIRRSKLPGQVWMMRLAASAIIGGKPGMLVHPAAAAERTTDGWLELRFTGPPSALPRATRSGGSPRTEHVPNHPGHPCIEPAANTGPERPAEGCLADAGTKAENRQQQHDRCHEPVPEVRLEHPPRSEGKERGERNKRVAYGGLR